MSEAPSPHILGELIPLLLYPTEQHFLHEFACCDWCSITMVTGATSTKSAPTTFIFEFAIATMESNTLDVIPPASNVPVPGA